MHLFKFACKQFFSLSKMIYHVSQFISQCISCVTSSPDWYDIVLTFSHSLISDDRLYHPLSLLFRSCNQLQPGMPVISRLAAYIKPTCPPLQQILHFSSHHEGCCCSCCVCLRGCYGGCWWLWIWTPAQACVSWNKDANIAHLTKVFLSVI